MLRFMRRAISSSSFSLSPKQLCSELDKFIVGQQEAKQAVAIALRTRWRRKQLPEHLRSEVTPKNILMIGPTGCGKTEIARRLAKLCGSPFIKVEATKFTEVGYHGRDVDQIIKDLVSAGIHQTKENLRNRLKSFSKEIDAIVEEYLLSHLLGPDFPENERKEVKREQLRSGKMDQRMIYVEIPDIEKIVERNSQSDALSIEDYLDTLKRYKPGRTLQVYKEKMQIGEAKKTIPNQITEGYMKEQNIIKEALEAVQEHGIVFIDEIDKIATSADAIKTGTNPSAEGVQRDLLPIIEGTMITTKHGDVQTDHILFIASGAFSETRPSDLLAELQGRLPVRVTLKALSKEDLKRILTEPENNLIKQNTELLKTEKIDLKFAPEAVEKIAEVADEINKTIENTGARRLTTVMEKILEDISFNAGDYENQEVVVTAEMVNNKVKDMTKQTDLRKYLL